MNDISVTVAFAAIWSLSVTAAQVSAGGDVVCVRPGTGMGKIVFIDTQTRLSEASIRKVIATLNERGEYNMVYERAQPGNPQTLKAAAKADLAVVIMDEPGKPTTLVAVDDGWAVVNVSSLDRSLKTEAAKKKFYEGRCRRQLLRVFALAAGGASSMYSGNICDPIRLEKLDLCKEALPFDVIVKIDKFLATHGVTKRVFVPYYDACEEGWAPPPTNDVQKAIWDKVHTPPKKPMKIEFDPKKGR